MKADVYERVTNQIIAELEKGVRSWHKPWTAANMDGDHPPLRPKGVPYRCIDVLMLWAAALEHGYGSSTWTTFKQALELGACVNDEKGSLVVSASTLNKAETDEASGETVERAIPFLKSYSVFNVARIEGLGSRLEPLPSPSVTPLERIAYADAFFTATGASFRHGGIPAYYSSGSDHIQMPPFEAFEDAEAYYATLAHETTHWTKAPARRDRDLGGGRFGDEGYAMEELVAELGAAFLCADLALTPETRPTMRRIWQAGSRF